MKSIQLLGEPIGEDFQASVLQIEGVGYELLQELNEFPSSKQKSRKKARNRIKEPFSLRRGFKSFYSIFQGAKGKGDRGKKELLLNQELLALGAKGLLQWIRK